VLAWGALLLARDPTDAPLVAYTAAAGRAWVEGDLGEAGRLAARAAERHPDESTRANLFEVLGDAALFRKLRDAYEQLIDWSENPTFTSRRGFADKWFYEGGLDRWTQPAPVRRTVPEE
jgi:hypothetical protein